MPRVKKTNLNKTASTDVKSKAVKKRVPQKKASGDKAARLVTKEIIKDQPKKAETKKESVKKTSKTKESDSAEIKRNSLKPKARPVVINIIEDTEDLTINNETFFPHDNLRNDFKDIQISQSTTSLLEDLNENLAEVVSEEVDSEGNEMEEIQEERLELVDVDRQKQFFSDLVSEIKSKREGASQTEEFVYDKKIKKSKKSLSLYRRIVWKFLLLVGFLAALVFYFSFSKLTIFITPKVEAMNDTLYLKVLETDNSVTTINDGREKISGSINELDLEITKNYRSTGEEYIGEEVSGKVFLINNYIKDQPLVATTRILTNDNKLFRIKKAVTIPAGGQVEVEVYADKIAPEMAINPTRFTIPGLWVGLQDKIYAESKEPFSYQQKVERYVRASDIQLANQEATSLLLERAREYKVLRAQDGILYQVLDPVEINLSTKTGDKVEEFSMTAKAKVVVVSFSQEEVSRLAVAKLNILVPDDKELADFKAENISYFLENYNNSEQIATIKTSFSGSMILKSNAEVIDRERLVNLSAEQISTYLREYPEIGSYELEFYPSFIKKAPHLVDRIQIKIKK